jgi:hypothetical protein
MSETITIEQAIFHFLHTVPETWTDYDPAKLSALQERALYLLTAAGMLERRVTLRLTPAGIDLARDRTPCGGSRRSWTVRHDGIQWFSGTRFLQGRGDEAQGGWFEIFDREDRYSP